MSSTSRTSALESSYPLSPTQQGMLYNSLAAAVPGIDVEQMVCSLAEPIEPAALRRAWDVVVGRHPILRTQFRWAGLDEPVQEVRAAVEIPFAQQDLRHLPLPEAKRAVEAFLIEDRRRGFRLDEAPLLRLCLFQLEDAHWELVWTFHHAILDGRSFPIVLTEVFDALDQRGPVEVTERRPYREHIQWLRRAEAPSSEAFWREALRGFSAPTPLVGGRSVEGAPSFDERQLNLSPAATSELYAAANALGVTLNTLVQGAWALLLARYSGEADVVFGATRACRRTAFDGVGADEMVGLFINTVPVRVPVVRDQPVREFVAVLRSRWRAIFDHEHCPLSLIKSWSELPAGAPLFESLLVFEEYLLDTVLRQRGGAWQNRSFRLLEQTGFPLTLAAYGGPELLLKIEFDDRRFERAFIDRMLGHLAAILSAFASRPDDAIGDLPLLGAEERATLLVGWNDTSAPRVHTTIDGLVEAQVDRTPDAPAVSHHGKVLSYRELDSRANRLANHLRALGVGTEDLVAVCCERTTDMLVAILGALKAGAAYVPLDPSYPKARIEGIVLDAKPRVILSQRSVADVLPQSSAQLVLLDAHGPVIGAQSDTRPAAPRDPSRLAYVIYTSGSTGRPKGVAIEHRSTVALIEWSRGVFRDAEMRSVLFSTSICFDLSVWEMFVTLAMGGKIVVAQNALELPSLPERDQITLINTVPTAINELSLARAIPPSVVMVNLAGEPLPLALAQQVYGSQASIERVMNLYGPTEDTTYSTWVHVERGQTSPVTIGKIMSNSQAYVLDPRRHPVPIGVPGELYLGGEGVARGYLNRPELTAERFVENPFAEETGHREGPGSRLYRTGDLARFLPDGQLEYLGRIDHQVKVRGFRIELGEIESVLMEHPLVKECVVVVREDEPGHKLLVAYAVSTATVAELHAAVSARLPDFMVPAAFVLLPELPQTPNGKVNRAALPVPELLATASSRVPPSGAVEEALVDLFASVLKLPVERIGAEDSFFELGGHSLLAVRLASRVELGFGKRLPLAALMRAATPRALAGLLANEKIAGELICINPPQAGRHSLFWCGQSFSQVRAFARHIGEDQPLFALESSFYNIKNPATHVRDVAERYAKLVVEADPVGPYLLGGFCIDGFVAFEIAQILKAEGRDVRLVAVVERDGPDALFKRLRVVTELARYHFRTLAGSSLADKGRYIGERLGRLPKTAARLIRRERGAGPDAQETATLSEAELHSRRAFAARGSYRSPTPYPGRVDLYFAADTHASIPTSLFPRCGWDRTVTGPTQVHVVPGDHDSINTDPDLATLARAVRKSVDEVRP